MNIEDYKTKASQGDPNAMFSLGQYYEKGPRKDLAQAAFWYNRASDNGNAMAEYRLGVLYAHGLGVAKDWNHALVWFGKAARHGIAEAKLILEGSAAPNPSAPPTDEEIATQLLMLGESGSAGNRFKLGICYANGTGVPLDAAKAAFWYLKAAELGHAEAQLNLGLCYSYGKGVPKDDTKATYWYRKAAEQGVHDAQLNLGINYSKGIGAPKNETEAYVWLNLAGSALEAARKNRDELESVMSQQARLEAQARSTEIHRQLELLRTKAEKNAK